MLTIQPAHRLSFQQQPLHILDSCFLALTKQIACSSRPFVQAETRFPRPGQVDVGASKFVMQNEFAPVNLPYAGARSLEVVTNHSSECLENASAKLNASVS